jgi:hypothetical protein
MGEGNDLAGSSTVELHRHRVRNGAADETAAGLGYYCGVAGNCESSFLGPEITLASDLVQYCEAMTSPISGRGQSLLLLDTRIVADPG